MKRKTIYTEQYVDCEYDIDFADVLELIESCDDVEISQIRNIIGSGISESKSNLYDDQKIALLKVAMQKYNLEELETKLNIKSNEY